MQKIILDTNVIVSALIQKSYPYLILHEIYLERKVQLCLSTALFDEYYEVLKRDKFSRFPDFIANANLILNDIYANAVWFQPINELSVIGDVDDNRLLELAVESNADYLITGNTNDFTMSNYGSTKIVSPKDYWEVFREI